MNVAHIDLVTADVFRGDVLELGQALRPFPGVTVGALELGLDGIVAVSVKIRYRPRKMPDAEVRGSFVAFCGDSVNVPEIELANCLGVLDGDDLIPDRPNRQRGVEAAFLELSRCDFQRCVNVNSLDQDAVLLVVDIRKATDHEEHGHDDR